MKHWFRSYKSINLSLREKLPTTLVSYLHKSLRIVEVLGAHCQASDCQLPQFVTVCNLKTKLPQGVLVVRS